MTEKVKKFFIYFCFQTHSGSVWKVTWAHPEFGQIIATCSFDRTVAVWEELGMIYFCVTINKFDGGVYKNIYKPELRYLELKWVGHLNFFF